MKNRKKYYKTEFWCFQLTWCDHTGCFLKNFTPHVKDKVIFPPCLWNRSTKIKLWETSSIRNTDRVAMQTRQIHQKICSMGLPLLIFYDIFLSRSITLTETQTTSSCLWCVTGTSPQHVFLPCAFYCTYTSGRQSRRRVTCSFVFCLFLLSLWMLTAVVSHTGTRWLYSPEQIQRGCTSGKEKHANSACEREMWVCGLASLDVCRLDASSLSQKQQSHFQLKTCPKQ